MRLSDFVKFSPAGMSDATFKLSAFMQYLSDMAHEFRPEDILRTVLKNVIAF